MPEKPRYRLYIDESGDHTINHLDDFNKRYLGITGIIARYGLDHLELHNEMESIKKDIFNPHPDEPIIFHREDIIARRKPFDKLLDVDTCKEFNARLLSLFANQHYTIIATVINKQGHQKRYGDRAFNPYNYCLTMILERYSGWLRYMGAVGDVIAESRGGNEDQIIAEEYSNIYEYGTLFSNAEEFQSTLTSKSIKIKKKYTNVSGLQFADLLAYSTKQDIMIERGIIEDCRTSFEKEIYECIKDKYNIKFGTGRVWGYGKIFRE